MGQGKRGETIVDIININSKLRPWSAVSTWVDQWVDLERFTGLLRKVLTHLWRFGGRVTTSHRMLLLCDRRPLVLVER